jgi:hypothetical protein
MNNITLFAPVRKTWTTEKCKNISLEIGICPACSSIDRFQYLYTCTQWRWDINIPENWTFGQWEQVKLSPVRVPLPVYCCTECQEQLKIFPSFCLRGTTLTLQALAFIGFVYETTELTWRDLPEMLCDSHNKIAHSTLYKAVHSTGKLMATEQEIQKLHLKYLPSNNPVQANPPLVWPAPKSIFTHTVAREQGIRLFLKNLLPGKSLRLKFQTYFYRWINSANRVFATWGKAINGIYSQIITSP